MAGLSNLIADTTTKATTLPTWMDQAQQNVVSQATAGAAQVPQLQNTVAGQAINTYGGASNPFAQAQNTLQGIATGAANPWIVTPQYSQAAQPDFSSIRNNPNFQGRQDTFGGADGSSILPVGDHPLGMPDMGNGNRMNSNLPPLGGPMGGVAASQAQGQPTGYNVAPNPNTALGGLFAAQNQQLQQLMPNITAPVTGANIASGNFGSLRGETAYNKAMGDAQAQLFAQQNQAALQNQQTGVQAAQGIGNIGAQDIAGANTLTNLQQTAPLSSSANLAKIIGALSVPTSVTSSTQLSPLSQIGSITSALGGGTNAVNSLLNSVKPGTNISSLLDSVINSFGGSGSGGGDAESQDGGFYGGGGNGAGANNSYANLTDEQIQYAMDNNYGATLTPDQILGLQNMFRDD